MTYIHFAKMMGSKLENKKDYLDQMNQWEDSTTGYCVWVEIQVRAKLASSTGNSFKIPVKEYFSQFFIFRNN